MVLGLILMAGGYLLLVSGFRGTTPGEEIRAALGRGGSSPAPAESSPQEQPRRTVRTTRVLAEPLGMHSAQFVYSARTWQDVVEYPLEDETGEGEGQAA